MANNTPFTISLSGKGFTSPRKYYSELSNSIEADKYIVLWIDKGVVDAASGTSDDYCAICIPGDWNTKAELKLDEELANLLKALAYTKVSAITRYSDGNIKKSTPENLEQITTQRYISSWVVNDNQMNIYYGDMIIAKLSSTKEEHDEWYAKYFKGTP